MKHTIQEIEKLNCAIKSCIDFKSINYRPKKDIYVKKLRNYLHKYSYFSRGKTHIDLKLYFKNFGNI
jgi:hypothetical protein